MMQGHYEGSPWGGIIYHYPDGRVKVVKRDFGLTWEDPCSREAHIQMHTFLNDGIPPPPGSYDSDPPSVTRPPGTPATTPPPMPPPPPSQPQPPPPQQPPANP